MKVSTTGSAGHIASTVASSCVDFSITPAVLDNLSTGTAEFVEDRIFYRGDIANTELADEFSPSTPPSMPRSIAQRSPRRRSRFGSPWPIARKTWPRPRNCRKSALSASAQN